jgi:hypothetical protein
MIGELLIHGIVFFVMVFLFATTYSFPNLNIGGKLGPGWWPRMVLGTGTALTLLSVFFSARKARAAKDKAKSKITKPEAVSLAVSTGIFLVSLLLIGWLGFVGVAPILVFGFMFQLGGRKPLSLVLVPVVSTVAFAVVFGRFMEVALPRGAGIMRFLSFYLY